MRALKNSLMALAAMLFVFLGAAMPWLVSRVQDARLSGFQKNLELNSVNLTLQQEMENVIPALEMVSKDYTESLWEGETVLTKAIASQAVSAALEMMEEYSLTPGLIIDISASYFDGNNASTVKTENRMDGYEGNVRPVLLTAEDGSSSLIWKCDWYFDDYWAAISVDDATGKVVRVFFDNLTANFNLMPDDIIFQIEHWAMFLQDYYDGYPIYVEPIDETELPLDDGNVRLSTTCEIRFVPNNESELYNGPELYTFNLEIASDYVSFNRG